MNKNLKKNRNIILIIIVGLVLIISSFLVLKLFINNEIIYGDLGQKVTIKKGQELRLKDRGVSIKINKFHNYTCPEHARCQLPDELVSFSVTIDGKLYKEQGAYFGSESGYSIGTYQSDFKTYATIVVYEI